MKQITKAIQIDIKIHEQLKQYCDDNGLKMQKLIEKLIIKQIENEYQSKNSSIYYQEK
jgi:hypothetical protein